MAVSWLINGGDPNYLLNGMILQVWLGDVFAFPFGSTCHPISGTMGTWTPKIMAIVNQPPPKRHVPPSQIHKGLIAGLIKGNQWLIGPDHKAGYFWGGYVARGAIETKNRPPNLGFAAWPFDADGKSEPNIFGPKWWFFDAP